MVPTSFDIRPLDLSPQGLRETAALLGIVWPKLHHLTAPYLDWCYNQNPSGHAVGFNACAEDRLVGHFATQPFSARIDGQEEKGILSINTVVHPAFRGRGFFEELVGRTCELAVKLGFGFVVGVANAQSTPLFLRLLGFQLVSPLEARIGLGSTPQRRGTSLIRYERRWDVEHLQWRLSHPGRPYLAKDRGDLTFFYSATAYPGVYAELGAFRGETVSARARFSKLISPLRLWIGLDPNRSWLGALYAPIPMRLRPAPLNLVFKDLTGRKRVLDSKSVLFSVLDFDAY